MGVCVMVSYGIVEHDRLADVAEVLRRSFNIYGRIGITDDYLKQLMRVDEGVKNGYIYGAWTEDKLVSVIMIVRRELSFYPSFLPVGGVANVATVPEYRGRGLARQLLTYAMNDLVEKGYSAAALFAGYGEPAYRIYRTHGFCDIITYWNRVCVLDDIDQAIKWLMRNKEKLGKVYGKVKVLSDEEAQSYAGNLKLLYYRYINKKYRGSVYRSAERWRGILSANPFETWFLGDPNNKIIVLTNGGVHGYAILYYMRESVLAKSHDRRLGVVTEIASRDPVEANALLLAVLNKVKEDGIKTVVFRPPPDIEEELPVCKKIGSPETLMFRVLDPIDFFNDIRKFVETRPIDNIEFCVKGKTCNYKVRIRSGSYEIDMIETPDCDIIIDETAFLRILLATTTAHDEYKDEYILIKQGNIKKTLDTLNDLLKGRRKHYLSLIDKW